MSIEAWLMVTKEQHGFSKGIGFIWSRINKEAKCAHRVKLEVLLDFTANALCGASSIGSKARSIMKVTKVC